MAAGSVSSALASRAGMSSHPLGGGSRPDSTHSQKTQDVVFPEPEPLRLRRPTIPLLAGSRRTSRDFWDVKGFRTPANHWREGVHGGRRPKSLEGGNRGGSSHRRWCRSMGNLPPLLDQICRFRTGRRLSDQRGAGFGRPGCDRPGDLVSDAAGFAGRRRR